MPNCSKCGQEHQRFRDFEHTKPASFCKHCHAGYMRETRPKHSELSAKQKKAANARSYARVYELRGILVRQNCEICGDENTERHHEDYDKPIDVKWLCRNCHMALHRQQHESEQRV